jgi:uncharacterized tellurite resistance protein B-like protein
MASEVGLGLIAGWHSITSLLGNLVCVVWNAVRLAFLKATPKKMEDFLTDLGAGSDPVDLGRVAASLAAAMIAADGKVLDEEVETAIELGQSLVDGFAPEVLIESLENVSTLPSVHSLAGLLADRLDAHTKARVLGYLLAVAAADRHVDETEVKVLEDAASALGVVLPNVAVGPVQGG